MSLLTIIREESIVSNVQAAGSAYKYITGEIRKDARSGKLEGTYTLGDFPLKEREHTVEALKLQGFNTHFIDESHRDAWVSWLPKHPR